MIASFSQQIELRFWDIIIPLLTRSEWVRGLVRYFANIYHNEKLTRTIALVFIIACGGFATGILAYTLTTLL